MDTKEEKKKINVKTVGAAIFILLIALLFMSKSIYSYNLPTVSAILPVNGKLSKQESVTATVEWQEKVNAYTSYGGKVEEVRIAEGDNVEEGDIIAKLSFTSEDLDASRNKAYEVETINRDISNAEEELQRKQLLYSEGAIPKNEVETAEKNLETLGQKRDKAETDYRESASKLDQSLLLVKAPCGGEVLTVDIHEGQRVNEGQLAASFGASAGLEINCRIKLDNNFVAVGDECTLDNTSHTITGLVTKLTPLSGAKEVRIQVPADQAVYGETFEVTFKKESSQSRIMIANGALFSDSDGYFVYQVKRRDGMLGKEFYLQKLRVFIGDSDDAHTVITEGITFFEPIVSISDKSLSEGTVVKLKNEGDFFVE